jgi:hypothetical protein
LKTSAIEKHKIKDSMYAGAGFSLKIAQPCVAFHVGDTKIAPYRLMVNK